MWEKIVDWILGIIPSLANFCDWLFTPININIVSENLTNFYKEYGQTFMGDGGGILGFTFITNIISSVSQPVYITPIGILSTSFLTIVFGILVVKFVVK